MVRAFVHPQVHGSGISIIYQVRSSPNKPYILNADTPNKCFIDCMPGSLGTLQGFIGIINSSCSSLLWLGEIFMFHFDGTGQCMVRLPAVGFRVLGSGFAKLFKDSRSFLKYRAPKPSTQSP